MANLFGRTWTRSDLLSYLSDPLHVAGAVPSVLSDGKADGVRTIDVRTGSGLQFTVLPGKSMDIPECRYCGKPIGYQSATGITSAAYYEEPGVRWLRSFNVGLLTTCGVTYAGPPTTDEGAALGLHGRIANAGAENVAITQEWDNDEFVISLRGTMREAQTMAENITLTRVITTTMGSRRIHLRDRIENRGFEAQPLMMLYHFNFGFPLLNERSRIHAPVIATVPRDAAAQADRGVEECLGFSAPITGYREKVFFHEISADRDGRTCVVLATPDTGDGTPLGVALRYSTKELPKFTEWKMMARGWYILGLEPGTVNPVARDVLRKRGELPFLQPQDSYDVEIEIEVLASREEIEKAAGHAEALAHASHGRATVRPH